MTTPIYQDPIIAKYRQLIEDHSSVFRAIYQGDPIVIPQTMLPALIIAKADTQVSHFTNQEDQHAVRMVLTVVTDLRSEISSDNTLVAGIAKLYEVIEGRNEDFTLKDGSILSILRTYREVDPDHDLRTDIGTISVSSFGPVLGNRDKESYSVEAQVTFTAHFIQYFRTA